MKLKKNYILILFIIYLVAIPLFLLIGSFFLSTSKKSSQISPTSSTVTTNTSPTPAFQLPPTYPPILPSDNTPHKHLVVVRTSPSNNQTVSTSLNNITLTFDQPVGVQDVPLSINPNIPYSISAQANSIIITPQVPLDPGMSYFVVLRLYQADGKIDLYTLTFKTSGPTPTGTITDLDPSAINQINQDELQNAPDVYVSNQTPHSQSTFDVTSDFKSTPTGHYYFTVTLKGDPNAAKNDFTTWLKSIGLNGSQIGSLDVVYH
jgi:methionine-rich copper-binding protein CopC